MMGSEEVHEHEYGEGAYHQEWRPRSWRTDWRRISWGAIFAGLFVTLAIFLTLQILGAGIGLSTVNLTGTGGSSTSNPRALSIGAGIWWFITGLISLFIGGWVAGRFGWMPTKLDRVLHGLTVWAFFYVVMFWVVTTALGVLAGGSMAVLGKSLSAAGQAATTPQGQQALSSDTIQQALASLTGGGAGTAQQGQAQGQQGQVQGQQNTADLAAAIADYYRGPQTKQNRQQVVQRIARDTGKSEAQANDMLNNLDYKAEQAKETGEQVANISGHTMIGLAIAMLIGAIVAMLGSLVATPPKYEPPHDYERPGVAKTEAGTYAAR